LHRNIRAEHGRREEGVSMQHEQGVSFGPYWLAGPQGPLMRDLTVVPLPPKEVAVLWGLTRRAGQVVSQEALFATVWGETIVSEGALTVCLRRLRQALGDDAAQARYITTVHRVGYRFIAQVIAAQTVPSSQYSVVNGGEKPKGEGKNQKANIAERPLSL